MNFGKDWSQACGVDGVMSLENSHALIAVLFPSMKFVLNFSRIHYKKTNYIL